MQNFEQLDSFVHQATSDYVLQIQPCADSCFAVGILTLTDVPPPSRGEMVSLPLHIHSRR